MAFKCFCDQKDCGVEIDDKGGFATITVYRKMTIFDPKNHQAMPQLSKKEFHLCEKHSKEMLEFIEESKVEIK